tara:strand:+ start:5564 stop:5833 length:270 start_codon:yes stop_codon:yes gene_type:complete
MEKEDPYFCGEEPPAKGYADHITQRFLDARAEWYCGCGCLVCYPRNINQSGHRLGKAYSELACYKQNPGYHFDNFARISWDYGLRPKKD